MTATPSRPLVENDIGCHVMAYLTPGSFRLKGQLFSRATHERHRQYDNRGVHESCSTAAADTHPIRRAPK